MAIEMPYSTLLIAFLAIGLNVASQALIRLLLDVRAMREMSKEIAEYRSELRRAIESRDRAKLEKLMRKEKMMREMEKRYSVSRMKPFIVLFGPFLLVYLLVIGFLGGGTVVAVTPIPIFRELTVPIWYVLSSFAFSGSISKLAGTWIA